MIAKDARYGVLLLEVGPVHEREHGFRAAPGLIGAKRLIANQPNPIGSLQRDHIDPKRMKCACSKVRGHKAAFFENRIEGGS